LNKRNFDILGIPPTTDKEKIKKAYRKKALLYHPDRNSDPKAHQLFIKITEAYETLVSQEKRPQINQDFTAKETAEEIKKRQFEERLRKAKFRYDILKKLEEIENEKYYLKITSGMQWRVFKLILLSCLTLAFLITIDRFTPAKTSYEFISASNKNHSFQGFFQSNIAPIKTENGEKFWLTGEAVLLLEKNNFVKMERTPIFGDIKAVHIWLGKTWYLGKTDFSVQGTFPLAPLFLLIPVVTYFLKSRTFVYSLLFNISLYLSGISLLLLLYFNDRWMRLILW